MTTSQVTGAQLRGWQALLLLLALLTSTLFLPAVASLQVHEAGDLAADMLQADVAARSGWWLFGHHSDVGVRHPGPAGLLLKQAFSHLPALGLFESVYGSSVAALLLLRLALLFAALLVLARASGSFIAPVLFAAPLLLLLVPEVPLGSHAAWLHFPASYVVFAMTAGWVAFAHERDAPPMLLLTAAGLGVHLHAPLAPVAGPLLLLAAAATLRLLAGRRGGGATLLSAALATLLILPLLLRVLVESAESWPLSYLQAARIRADAAASFSAPGRPRLFFLEQYSGFPGPVAVALMVAALLLAAATLASARHRMLGAGLIWIFGTGLLTTLLSDPQQLIASEMLWVAGLPATAAGLLAATAYLLVRRAGGARMTSAVPPRLQPFASALTRCSPAFAALLLLPLLAPLPASASTGADLQGGLISDFVPATADLFEASGATALLLSRGAFLPVEAGLALELRRREVPFCVTTGVRPPPAFEAEMGWFFLDTDRCGEAAAELRPVGFLPAPSAHVPMLEFDAGFSFAPRRFVMLPICPDDLTPPAGGAEGGWDGC